MNNKKKNLKKKLVAPFHKIKWSREEFWLKNSSTWNHLFFIDHYYIDAYKAV